MQVLHQLIAVGHRDCAIGHGHADAVGENQLEVVRQRDALGDASGDVQRVHLADARRDVQRQRAVASADLEQSSAGPEKTIEETQLQGDARGALLRRTLSMSCE